MQLEWTITSEIRFASFGIGFLPLNRNFGGSINAQANLVPLNAQDYNGDASINND